MLVEFLKKNNKFYERTVVLKENQSFSSIR